MRFVKLFTLFLNKPDLVKILLDSEKITKNSSEIEEVDRQALRDVGFSDRDIWDIANVAGFFNMTNRVASAVDMRPNDDYHAQSR